MNRKPGLVGECEGAPPLSGSVLSGTTPGFPLGNRLESLLKPLGSFGWVRGRGIGLAGQ